MSKEPTRAQLSSRLAYSAQTPAFLQKLQRQYGGGRRDSDEDDEWEYDGSGRPPIPKRPAIPERPLEDPGSADEDDIDEKPQIVVLKEGKHLSEREVENENRKAKGLPPLPEVEQKEEKGISEASSQPVAKGQSTGLSFSSSSASRTNKKRKAVGDGKDEEDKPKPSKSGKKAKKAEKKLLSFDEEA